MIKETVDAVRLAELEGDKVISTAKVNGQDMKVKGSQGKSRKGNGRDSCKMRKVQR